MNVTMLLADHAQVAAGKLFLSGVGWNLATSGPLGCGVGMIFELPWDLRGKRISFTVRLQNDQGQTVLQAGALGETPVRVNGHFEVGTPAGATPGDSLHAPVAFNAQLQLTPGRYEWHLEIDDDPSIASSLPFRIVEALPKGMEEQ